MLKPRLLTCLLALLAAALLRPATGLGMESPLGMVEQPCLPALQLPEGARLLLSSLFMQPRTLAAEDFADLMRNDEFSRYNQELQRRGGNDWAGLCRFQQANAAATPGSTRVVFIGDSITENWLLADPEFFTGGIVNRGISAQTSAQMLVRFRADVVRLHPAAVHILAGTNDVAGNGGPTSPADFQNNIESMAELARANGIHVILGSIPPAGAFSWRPTLQPAAQIVALNQWLRDYAARNRFTYVDYHAALKGAAGELKATLGNDGVHPNRDGYVIMRRLAQSAISQPGGNAARVPR
jgi:lysophospholipase L1-like esterase